MTRFKRSMSLLLTAGLLASLFTVTAAPIASGATTNVPLLEECSPSSCSQVVGSFVTIFGAARTSATTGTFAFTVSGGSFITASGGLTLYDRLTLANGVTYASGWVGGRGQDITTSSSIEVYSNAVGTATITEWVWNQAWLPTGNTYDITFYGQSGLLLSSANSFSKIIGTGGICMLNAAKDVTTFIEPIVGAVSADRTNVATVCVRIENAVGNPVPGVTVTGAISPVGAWLESGGGVGQFEDKGNGLYVAALSGNSLPGDSTVTVTATKSGLGTITLNPGKVTYLGKVASISATPVQVVGQGVSPFAVFKALTFISKDSAGHLVGSSPSLVASSKAPFVAATPTPFYGANATDPGDVMLNCTATGSGTATLTESVDGRTISSTPITIYCSGPATSWNLSFTAPTVAPGGRVGLSLAAKDAQSQPAYLVDGSVAATVNSGALLKSGGTAKGDGTLAWTYIAPSSAGTATAGVSYLGSTKTASIRVTGTATAGRLAARVGTGAYSTAARVAARGARVTWRSALGSAYAGRTVAVYVQTRTSAGTWSAQRRWTSVTANGSGVATFSKVYRASTSIRIRFVVAGFGTNWVTATWR